MYLQYFGLKDVPFRITPDTDFWFPGAQRGEILEALIHALAHGEGLIKVVGEVGSGKTMLLRVLMTRLPDTISAVYLANPTLSADEMLAALLTDLGDRPKARANRQIMLDNLNKRLLEKHAAGQRVAVFVEEAQAMSLDSLEFLRLLTNLETARDKLLQIVLFGQPELDQLLSVPRIRQIRDRITLNINLPPLTADTIPAYLNARLEKAGYRGPDLFSPRVVRAIARYSGGLTRRINVLADKTLLAGYGEQTRNLTMAHVKAAVKDSEISPKKTRFLPNWTWITTGLAASFGLVVFLKWLGMSYAMAVPDALAAEPQRMRAADVVTAVLPQEKKATLADKTLDWLARTDPDTYVIQLYTAKDQADTFALIKRLSKLDVPLPLGIVPTKHKQGDNWIVLAGAFKQRAEAQSALAKLPDALRAHQPFLMTVRNLRSMLNNSTQKVSS